MYCFLAAKSVSISSSADFFSDGSLTCDELLACWRVSREVGLVYVFGPEAGVVDLFFDLLIVVYGSLSLLRVLCSTMPACEQ